MLPLSIRYYSTKAKYYYTKARYYSTKAKYYYTHARYYSTKAMYYYTEARYYSTKYDATKSPKKSPTSYGQKVTHKVTHFAEWAAPGLNPPRYTKSPTGWVTSMRGLLVISFSHWVGDFGAPSSMHCKGEGASNSEGLN